MQQSDEREEKEKKIRQTTSVYSVASSKPLELRSKNEKKEKKRTNECDERSSIYVAKFVWRPNISFTSGSAEKMIRYVMRRCTLQFFS